MSLINDALKRARQVQARPPVIAAVEPALEPAVALARAPIQTRWLIPVGAGLLLLLACWSLSRWWRASQQEAAAARAAAQTTNQAAEVMSAVTQLTKEQQAKTAPVRVNPPFFSARNVSHPPVASDSALALSAPRSPQAAVLTRAEPTIANTVPEPVPPPLLAADSETALKLQGIFYRSSRASALINGQTLFVGDEIGGATLVAIERQAVRLLHNGRTNVLKLH
jgi:hypothetical protein